MMPTEFICNELVTILMSPPFPALGLAPSAFWERELLCMKALLSVELLPVEYPFMVIVSATR